VAPANGYGLTETTSAVVSNSGADYVSHPDSVGRCVPGADVRVVDPATGDDVVDGAVGELWFRGPNVVRGYWNNPEATAAAFTDGWFHTGDLGELDSDGYLKITGRKKELIVTAGGKNVAPAVIEDGIRAHRLISQALVVGDNRPYVAALITLDPEALPAWSSEHGKSSSSPEDLADDEDLRREIAAAVDDANKAVSKAESVRQFRILASDFTEDSGELTPTLKLKRNVITDQRADDIEAVYAQR